MLDDSVSLKQNFISCTRPVGAEDIATALARNRSINELRFSRNDIRSRGLSALCRSLTYNETLKILALNRSGLREDGARTIGQNLPDMVAVEHLALQHNELGNAGVGLVLKRTSQVRFKTGPPFSWQSEYFLKNIHFSKPRGIFFAPGQVMGTLPVVIMWRASWRHTAGPGASHL